METVTIILRPDGRAAHIHDEVHGNLFACLGDVESTRRASHVDTTRDLCEAAIQQLPANVNPNDWWADMSPVGGPLLGPYSSRKKALASETTWLLDNNLPERVDDE